MVIEDVTAELDKCLKRKELSRTRFAELIHVSKQAVSNWFSSDEHKIPVDKLLYIVDVLGDERFRFVVADYILDTRLLTENSYGKDPLSQFVRVNKEESERRILNEQVTEILAKTGWSQD